MFVRRRSGWLVVYLSVLGVVVLAMLGYVAAVGGWDTFASALTGIALGALIVCVIIGLGRRSQRRRMHRIEAFLVPTRPEWQLVGVTTTPTLLPLMRAVGFRMAAAAPGVLAYGPTGVELWAQHQRRDTPSLAATYPWGSIHEVLASDDVRDYRGTPLRGLRIVLAGLNRIELIVSAVAPPVNPRDADPVAKVADDMRAARSRALGSPGA